MNFKDLSSRFLAGVKNPKTRPPFEAFYVYALALIIGYAVADLSILNYRPNMLPTKAPPVKKRKKIQQMYTSQNQFRTITDRNLFNFEGKIPSPLTSGEGKGGVEMPPVESKLPIKLLGTIVLADPKRSIATINLNSKNRAESYRFGERIESMAEVLSVERRKVIIRNLATNRREFIQIPEEEGVDFGLRPAESA